MPFSIRHFRRFPVQCAVTYNAGLFLKLPLVYFSCFGSVPKDLDGDAVAVVSLRAPVGILARIVAPTEH